MQDLPKNVGAEIFKKMGGWRMEKTTYIKITKNAKNNTKEHNILTP